MTVVLTCDSHFFDLSSDLDNITTKQTDQFVASLTTLFLTTDDTTTSQESKSLHDGGLINELGVFHCFKNKLTVASTVEFYGRQILEVLTPDIMNKFSVVIADTLASQNLASKLILAKLAEKTAADDLPTDQLKCMLHT